MPSLEVNVARVESRSPLWVDRALIERLPELIAMDRYSTIAVISDNGAREVTSRLQKTLSLSDSRIMMIEGGERQKDVEGLLSLWSFFADLRLDRKSLVITVGGGATSDLVGFAASTYMRGVPFIHIPTTLLAQVDASIGGKSGINFKGVKNLIGSIAQPEAIVIDVDALSTLPEREVRSGFAEIVKHGLIADQSYFSQVTSRNCLSWSPDELVGIIYRSCEIKKSVVESDEREQGLRKTLNFGHSIGHAVESYALEHGPSLTHGEAVAIGMVGEAFISAQVGKISRRDLETIEERLHQAGLPIRLPSPFPSKELRELIGRDKKNVGGAVKWSLLERIGSATFDITIPEAMVLEALEYIQPR